MPKEALPSPTNGEVDAFILNEAGIVMNRAMAASEVASELILSWVVAILKSPAAYHQKDAIS